MSTDSLRIDKWLWQARFFKSRSLASKFCQSRQIRLNSNLLSKAHTRVKPGDILAFEQHAHIRIIKVVMLGERRGPACEAQTLYEDLAPKHCKHQKPGENTIDIQPPAQRPPGTGRPTKKERRLLDKALA